MNFRELKKGGETRAHPSAVGSAWDHHSLRDIKKGKIAEKY